MVAQAVASSEVLWQPPADVLATTAMGRYLTWLASSRGVAVSDYEELRRWSVDHLGEFWASIADYFGLDLGVAESDALADAQMPGASWFPDATLNFAEQALTGDPDSVAICALSETRPRQEVTRAQLRGQVAALRATLLERGVGAGDRVVAYLPNIPETLVVLYAAASIGAIFASVAPESGSRLAIAKLAQLEPKVLVAIDGYRYGAVDYDRADTVAEIRAELPTLELTIALDYLHPGQATIPDAIAWSDATATRSAELKFAPLPFAHPLYIVFSSGTTGRPKAIVHSHGGIVLEHLKLWGLHEDIGPDDRWFWYSSTNWVAWNYCASVLMCGAALVCYDGHPMKPGLVDYWHRVADEKVTWLGVSPSILLACQREGLRPGDVADLSSLRGVTCGGSPLTIDLFRWVYDAVSADVYLSSGSGGTEIASCFVAGTRLLPVRAGEIACRLLGVDAVAYDESGHEVVGQRGELVIRQPMPSMPLGFWGDQDGSRYREAYFERFPGVWCHGDWVLFTPEGTCRVTGRSDATLNRGGVRLGTSDFYEVIDDMPEITDSLIVHVEDPHGGLGALILFVTTPDGGDLSERVQHAIRQRLRSQLSARHEPDEIRRVDSIPKTLTGKRREVPVKRALQDPAWGSAGDGLEEFRAIGADLRRSSTVEVRA